MRKRIVLVHAYLHSMAPIDAAFKAAWPEAQTLNVVDETLYADVPPDGTLSEALYERVLTLLRHCERSGAHGIVFTGSTFGPAVERARQLVNVPVLKADEATGDAAVAAGKRILLVCTQQRAMAIVRPGLDAAVARAGSPRQITELWVDGAKDAMAAGGLDAHDRLIAARIAAAAEQDVIVLGQISMDGARKYLPAELARRVVTSSQAAVARMRALVGDRSPD
jgi:Asp/Glu/hydantoin racemase